jgi:peptidoglycan/LPS O-acetylase OafA/YrhL
VRLSPNKLNRLTPSARDRYVDFLRALSIVIVVVGHWTIALIFWEESKIFVHNVVGHQSGLWLATWVLQVMPLFFFVGGFSNAKGWGPPSTRKVTYHGFMRKRLSRLLRPTIVFVAVWIGGQGSSESPVSMSHHRNDSSARVATPSFSKMCDIWLSSVLTLMPSFVDACR